MKVISLDPSAQRTLVDSRKMVDEAKAQLILRNQQHRLRIEQHLAKAKTPVTLKKHEHAELTDDGTAVVIR